MEQESPRRLVRCFSPSRTTSASLKQNADSRRARICYPLHRMAGQAFWIRERCRGPPPTYLLVAESGEVFSVPVWMTEPSAAEVRDEERPRAHVRSLLEMFRLMKKGLEPFDVNGILPSDQAKEMSPENRTTPTDVDTGSTPSSPPPTREARSRSIELMARMVIQLVRGVRGSAAVAEARDESR
jgi:hypothetical protein